MRICNISSDVNDSSYWQALETGVFSSKTQCLLVQYKLSVFIHTFLLQSLFNFSNN